MSSSRITDLSSIDAVALTDVVHVVDTSDTTSTVDGTSKKATISQVKTALSIPSTTSDLAEGTNLYYTEARVAANSAVAANTEKVTNATHTGDVTGSGALTIANDVVTNAKLANVATNTIKGRVTASTGDPEDLTVAQVRTLLNVEDGATADQTAGEIKTAYESNLDTNAYTDAEKTKLGTVETNADVTDATNVQAAGALMDSEKGANSGVAELDAGGKVPSAQLPSFVDDVLEYADLASFPATGETGKIYVAKDTNIVYRWSGTAYVEISASLALGETSSTAYRGDRGKIAYDYSQVGHVALTGNQNVAGVKTFSSSPIVPAPTTDLQAATKKYVDDNAGGGGGDVVGPASATDNSAVRFDGTTGKLVQDSSVTILDGGNVGIGTTSPSAILDIYKTSPTADQTLLHIGTSVKADVFEVDEDGDISADGTKLQLGAFSGGTTSRIYSGTSGAGNSIYIGGSGTNSTVGVAVSFNSMRLRTSSVLAWTDGSAINTASDTSLSRLSVGVLGVGTGITGGTDGTLIAGNVGIGNTAPDTKLHVAGAYTQEPLSADPADPAAGNSVQWVSDGTGSGSAGDVMMKINVGGTVKTVTLVDYSVA